MRRILLLVSVVSVLCGRISQAQDQPRALAPILVEPYNGKDVSEEHIVWTWFMQARAANGEEILCDLAVAEILEGQTPEEAMRANPKVLLRQNLTVSTWQSPLFTRSLKDGRSYAWTVTAKVRQLGTGRMQIVSGSEIWTFTYKDPVNASLGDSLSRLSASVPVKPEYEKDAKPTDSIEALRADPPADSVGTSAITDPEVPARPDAIAFGGMLRQTSLSENRRGQLSTTPVRFDRLQLEPEIKLFGVPLNLSVLLSTEGTAQQSSISRGAFGTSDVRKGLNLVLRQKLEDQIGDLEAQRDSLSITALQEFRSSDSLRIAQELEALRTQLTAVADEDLETLRSSDLLTEEQKTLALFPSFGFGKVAPSFGNMLFNRVTINGGMMEYNPSGIYLAGAAGKVERFVDIGSLPPEAIGSPDPNVSTTSGGLNFFNNIYSARIGYGDRTSSHIALTGIFAEDDGESLTLQDLINRPLPQLVERFDDTTGELIAIDTILVAHRFLGRQKNYGFGAAGRLEEKTLGLDFDGEFNVMYFDDDAGRLAQQLIPRPEALPSFLQSDSALTDFNFAFRAKWELPEAEYGRLDAGIRYVGGGFRSIGLAGLRSDVLRGDAVYRLSTLRDQIVFRTNYSYEEAGYKDSLNTSLINALGANLDLRFSGLPSVALAFTRHGQNLVVAKRDTNREETTNVIEQFVASLTNVEQFGEMRWSTFASAMFRHGTSAAGDPTSEADSTGIFSADIYQLNNRVAFSPDYALGLVVGYTSTVNHPTKAILSDTAATRFIRVREATDDYTADLSFLMKPAEPLQFVLGAVTSYQGDFVKPAIMGGYTAVSYLPTENISIELRFDYREPVKEKFKSLFPLERSGRLVTTVRL